MNFTLAGGKPALANVCFGYLVAIDTHQFTSDTIQCAVAFMGSCKEGLIGLDLLNRWVTEFHGPNGVLTVSQ